MLVVRMRSRPLWVDLRARQAVFQEMAGRVVGLGMVPQLVTELLHFNHWNKDLPYHPPQHYSALQAADAFISRVAGEECRAIIREAL
jgi:hypothetical protein